MKKTKTTVSTIDEYLAGLSEDKKDALQRVRNIIRKIVPDFKERISYQVPIISFGKDLVGFSGQKDYCSFYTMSPPLVKEMSKELKDFKVSGATIHFTPDQPLPVSIIKNIIKRRLEEIK